MFRLADLFRRGLTADDAIAHVMGGCGLLLMLAAVGSDPDCDRECMKQETRCETQFSLIQTCDGGRKEEEEEQQVEGGGEEDDEEELGGEGE